MYVYIYIRVDISRWRYVYYVGLSMSVSMCMDWGVYVSVGLDIAMQVCVWTYITYKYLCTCMYVVISEEWINQSWLFFFFFLTLHLAYVLCLKTCKTEQCEINIILQERALQWASCVIQARHLWLLGTAWEVRMNSKLTSPLNFYTCS